MTKQEFKKQIQAKLAEIKVAEDANSKLWQKKNELEGDILKLRFAYMESEGFLSTMTWKLRYRTQLYSDSPRELENRFEELFSKGWNHWSAELAPGVQLRGDDGFITLNFDGLPTMLEFCKAKGLRVSAEAVKEQESELDKEIIKKKSERSYIRKLLKDSQAIHA